MSLIPTDLSLASIDELERILGNFKDELSPLELARDSYKALLLRTLEMRICAEPDVLGLIRTPAVYLGREREIIEQVLRKLSANVCQSDVDYFVHLVRSGVAHRTSKTSGLDQQLSAILERDYSPGDELRCKSCGYHFERRDMRAARREVVSEADLLFAPSNRVQPGRLKDPWKPKDEDSRKLSIDHVVPEAALGSSELRNLTVRCQFCNKSKQIILRFQEAYPGRVAASLLAMAGGDRGQWAFHLAVYFSIQQSPKCDICSSSTTESELTAVPRNGDRRWTSLLPTHLATRCYPHSGLED